MTGPAVEARTPMAKACGDVVPFGKHKGETIARVGASDAGLAYLRWISRLHTTRKTYADFSRSLWVYLGEPSIEKRLDDMGPNFDARAKRT